MSGRNRSVGTDLLIGAIAGLAATTVMTLSMAAMFRRLPAGERYPLPPRELTERTAAALGTRQDLDEPRLRAATLASHFGFGAAAGSLYGSVFLPTRPSSVSGIGYGLFVWAVSYLGWVPALGLLRPATGHPPRRNALMVAAHVVWGSALGFLAHRLSRALTAFSDGPLGDR